MIKRLQSILKKGEGLILNDASSRKYFLGFESSAGFILVRKNDALFAVDARYSERAKSEIKNVRVSKLISLDETLKEFFGEGVKKVFITPKTTTVEEYKRFTSMMPTIKISKSDKKEIEITKMRSIKTEEEIEKIKEAIAITDRVFSEILEYFEEGVTEKYIRDTMLKLIKEAGGEGEAFPAIVVFGENTKNPHGVPSDKKLRSGEFVTLDFGAVKNGYCSDMTRTIAFGQPSGDMVKLYNTVLLANESAEKGIRAGMSLFDCDKLARDITEKEYPGKFVHGLGHGIGMVVHEAPFIGPKSEGEISKGMIFSVEPGIYLEDMGVRIEDLVLATDDGVINLCSSKKELIVLGV